MRRFLTIVLVLLTCAPALGGEVTFSGSSMESMRRVSTVAEYTGRLGPTGNLLDSSGHGFDMTPTAAPPTAFSDLQDSAGNRVTSRSLNGTTQYYSVAHNALFNIFDTDFTLTLYIRPDGSNNTIFAHGLYNADGIYVRTTAAGGVFTYLNKAGSGVAMQTQVTLTQGQWYVVQIVRRNNTLVEWINGVQYHVTGAATDASTCGIDGARSMYLGAYDGGILIWAGQLAYARLDAEALRVEDLQADVERLQGIHDGGEARWRFTRSTGGEKSYSAGGVTTASVNAPRVSAGGVLVTPVVTNILAQSDSYDSGTWTKFYASSPNPNTYTGPDGLLTADILHEDGTAAQPHAFYQLLPGGGARVLSFSIDVKKFPGGPRDWIFIDFYAGAIYGTWFNVASGTVGSSGALTLSPKIVPLGDGWWRISISGLSTAAAAQYVEIRAAPSDAVSVFDGLNTDDFLLARGQVEVGTPATTFCGPTLADPVVCGADSLTLPIGAPALVSIGDSIARGLNPYIDTLYGNVRNAAWGGYKTADLLNIVQTNVIHSRARHAFVHVGINDIVADIPAATIEANIEALVTALEAANVTVTIDNIGTASVAQYTAPRLAAAAAVNLWLRTTFAAAHPRAQVLDFLSWATGGTNDPTAPLLLYFDPGDPVHPNAAGYASWAAYVYAQRPFPKTAVSLPLSFGSAAPAATFLTVEVETRCAFLGSADVGQNRILAEISGNAGSASATRNRVQLYVSSTGRLYGKLIDDAGVEHYGYSAVDPVLFTKTNVFKLQLDFANLANMAVLINGSAVGMTYSGNAGAATMNLENAQQRIGQNYNGDVSAACTFARYRAEPFRF